MYKVFETLCQSITCGTGLLEVCIRYKHRPVRTAVQPGGGAASQSVTLVIQVHRASGLQAAARYFTTTALVVLQVSNLQLCYFEPMKITGVAFILIKTYILK